MSSADEVAELKRLLQEKEDAIANLRKQVESLSSQHIKVSTHKSPPKQRIASVSSTSPSSSVVAPQSTSTAPIITINEPSNGSSSLSPQWTASNPFKDAIQTSQTNSKSFSMYDFPAHSPNASRRKTIDPREMQQNLAALNMMRRSTSVSEKNDDETPALLAEPPMESNWNDDNPFAFLKSPAPPPPSVLTREAVESSTSRKRSKQASIDNRASTGPTKKTDPSNSTPLSRAKSNPKVIDNYTDDKSKKSRITFNESEPNLESLSKRHLESKPSQTKQEAKQPIKSNINELKIAQSTMDSPMKQTRRRSHSSTSKTSPLSPPPPLVAPIMVDQTSNNNIVLSDIDAKRLRVIQAYFRGRIERARVKHMVEKQVMQRRFTMEEILLSERRYVHHLDLILTHFQRPLLKSNLLSPNEMSNIFMNVEHIYQLARSFLKQLEELFVEDPLLIGHRVGLLFLTMIPEWRTYSHFLNHFEGALAQVAKLKEKKAFKEWLAKAESHPALEKLGMMDYMIAAAKRIPQYELLLKAVKKSTPKSSRHYQTIRTAKQMVSELAQFLNEKKKSFENMQKIDAIQKSLNGKIPNLQSPGRELLAEAIIKEEELVSNPRFSLPAAISSNSLKSANQGNSNRKHTIYGSHGSSSVSMNNIYSAKSFVERRAFLFNDCIVLATHPTNKFDRLIYFSGGEMNSNWPNKIILKVGEIAFVAVFLTENEKNRWATLMGHAIETLKFQEQDSVLKEFASTSLRKPTVVNSVVLKQGFLMKHRRMSAGWNKRWFVLEQGMLYYFKNPNKMGDITERGTIDISLYRLRAPVDWQMSGKMRFGFELFANNQAAFILAAENPEERDEWIKALLPFLSSAKNREDVLLAASTSTEVYTTPIARVLVPIANETKNQAADENDLILWNDESEKQQANGRNGLTSSKFYFNEDTMTRSLAVLPSQVDLHSQALGATPSPPNNGRKPKTHVALRRSLSSSSVSGST